MSNIFLFVKYNGSWLENRVFKANNAIGISVPPDTTYDEFIRRLYEALNITPSSHTICVMYESEPDVPPIKISNDRELSAYFDLKNDVPEKAKHIICVHISDDGKSNEFLPRGVIEYGIVEASPIYNDRPTENDFEAPYITPSNQILNGEFDNFTSHSFEERTSNGSPYSFGGHTRENRDGNGGPSSTPNNGESEDSTHSSPLVSKSVEMLSEVYEIDCPTRVKLFGLYANKESLQRHIQMYAITNHFYFKVKTSKKKEYHVVCRGDNCKWAVRGVRLSKTQIFQIRRFDADHTCSTDSRQGEHPQATSSLIGDCIKHKYIDPTASACRPKDIIQFMQQDYGVSLCYKKALRSKEKALEALYGTDEDSYGFLPTLSYMLQTNNPGSVIDLVTDNEDHFMYYFMSMSAFIQGWQYCRPVIIVDATFLKAYYRGTLFTACAMDGNEQVFPLAFGVGDGESNESWEYFFVKLKEAIGDREELVIVSDRHNAIQNAVQKVYPNAEHGYCMFHILGNIKNKYRRLPKEVNWKFYAAAKAYTRSEWEKYMQMLDEHDRRIRLYLATDVGHEKWARSLFTSRRYSIMTSNNAESMNAASVKPREFPISKLIEWLRDTMQQWFYDRREKAAGTFTLLSQEAEKRLRTTHAASTGMTVNPSSVYTFFVVDRKGKRWVVNLDDKTCDCREFQTDQFICSHAIAACRLRGFPVYDYISGYYKKENWQASYAGVVYPIGSVSTWIIPDEVKHRKVYPPKSRHRQPGRPKKRRILSQGEEAVRQKCSRCGQGGHNRKTCKSSVPLSQRRKRSRTTVK